MPFYTFLIASTNHRRRLYEEDRKLTYRKSHHNPEVKRIYERFLGAPNSELAHKLLHTHYFERSVSTGQVVKEATHKHH
ncbi:MAG: hypothetical protein CVV53_03930 [Spirochaetae bacterium HGW-Spirochaetae-9]|nr:MAG: hypothetical protein CVV53_03930 [Spirochaetae bacterium HGW-Spirochaetae-9]